MGKKRQGRTGQEGKGTNSVARPIQCRCPRARARPRPTPRTPRGRRPGLPAGRWTGGGGGGVGGPAGGGRGRGAVLLLLPTAPHGLLPTERAAVEARPLWKFSPPPPPPPSRRVAPALHMIGPGAAAGTGRWGGWAGGRVGGMGGPQKHAGAPSPCQPPSHHPSSPPAHSVATLLRSSGSPRRPRPAARAASRDRDTGSGVASDVAAGRQRRMGARASAGGHAGPAHWRPPTPTHRSGRQDRAGGP